MSAPPDDRSRLDLFRRIGWAAFAACVAFGPAAFVHAPLLRGELPVFRDVRHFYQPMERRQQQAWSAGRIPLWNAEEGTGFPEFAEPTAATFYPGKFVFALPIPWGVRWFLYFVGHAGLACFGARRFARSCGLSSSAGLLAGAAYAASGEALFQSCNPVYLVGAAWLPWALVEATFLRRTLKLSHAVGLAASTTMAFLGGDPQTVYHAALLIAAAFLIEVAVASFLMARRRLLRDDSADRRLLAGQTMPAWLSRVKCVGLLAFAAALTVGLSAIQLLPAVEWFRESDRALLKAGDAAERIPFNRYDFSVGPWRWADFLVPEALGSPFPIQRRWSYAVVPESRVWTPSHYLGLAPLLLLPAGLNVSRTRRRALLPLGLAFAALGFALGQYGLGYFAEEVAVRAGGSLDVESPWGGPYWMLAEWAPWYDLFRYPAKWMPAASLGIAVAGAAGLDALRYRAGCRTALAFAAMAFASFLLLVSATWLPWVEAGWFALPIGSDSTFGPWDAAGALADLRANLAHAAIASLALAVPLSAVAFFRERDAAIRLATPALILLATIDPAIANRNLVPAGKYDPEPAESIEWTSLGVEAEGPAALRYLRGSLDRLPAASWKEASPDRLNALAEWERSSYFARLGPGRDGPPALRSSASLEPADLAPFLSAWRDSRLTGRDPAASATIDRLEALSVGLLILPPGVQPVRGEFVRNVAIPPTDSQVAIWRLPEAQPRWAVTQDPALLDRAKQALESDEPLTLSHDERRSLRQAELRFEEADERGVSFQHDYREPTLLIWNDRFDRGWQVERLPPGEEVQTEPHPVGEVHGTGRFVVLLGPGELRFDYRPPSLRQGAAITLLAIFIALAALAWRPFQSRPLPAFRRR